MNPAQYSVVEATSGDQLKHHYHLRYRVFCEEKGFEPSEQAHNGLERDSHDSAATHFLVRRHLPGRSPDYPATVRWLPGRIRPLPIEKICQTAFPLDPNLDYTAELSRFIIRDSCLQERFNIFSALAQHFYQYSRARDTRYLLLLIQPALLRILYYRGVHAKPFGTSVQFRGTRIPCYIDLAMHGGRWAGDAETPRCEPKLHQAALSPPSGLRPKFNETRSRDVQP